MIHLHLPAGSYRRLPMDTLKSQGLSTRSNLPPVVDARHVRPERVAGQGIYGDPTYGSAEKGERMFEAIAGCLADIVGDLQSGRF